MTRDKQSQFRIVGGPGSYTINRVVGDCWLIRANKTVYLTREEAESAKGRMEGKRASKALEKQPRLFAAPGARGDS